MVQEVLLEVVLEVLDLLWTAWRWFWGDHVLKNPCIEDCIVIFRASQMPKPAQNTVATYLKNKVTWEGSPLCS